MRFSLVRQTATDGPACSSPPLAERIVRFVWLSFQMGAGSESDGKEDTDRTPSGAVQRNPSTTSQAESDSGQTQDGDDSENVCL